ncbi:hypothetical protein LXL04_025485 [Taraxacum kok-saghyz]
MDRCAYVIMKAIIIHLNRCDWEPETLDLFHKFRRREVESWNVITSVNPYREIVRLGGGAAQLQSVEEHSVGAAPVGRKNWRTAGRTREAPEELEDRRSREEELWNAG